MRKESVALLLAGGEGRRLGALTHNTAKPAVHFAGKYRMIDYALSNCRNSGIDTIGVVTQYKPESLHQHIGNGTAWLNEPDKGSIELLCSDQEHVVGNEYTGTANAVYQNRHFIEKHDPEFVVVLSGDHIYQMDYSEMIRQHKERGSEATIAVKPVGWDEASRFGIMNADEQGRVVEFEEKPARPKSNLASMGIYVFNWDFLKKVLERDDAAEISSHDFGKDVIPMMVEEGAFVHTFSYEGYWKDVGTIDSLWQAQMDLLHESPLQSEIDWPMYTAQIANVQPHIDRTARVDSSLISENCAVYGSVNHSVVSHGVYIGKGSVLTDCVIMPNVRIGNNVKLHKAIIGEGSVLCDGVTVGKFDAETISVVGDHEVMYKVNEKLPKIYMPRLERIG
ncbi:glucose-1-phosphate adenylyltransferase [Paenibacillus sp. FJAT-26967]|uniref:glucose-1-phosphate adenylyltransferase n=1 Tax=Paenibacillus sp. FJAT-26967 TaxID=1729690 RepID=UPI0008385F40|nr:glucose-1-phosphate adenylyltransferase [Paenibacillus sp. FJAT-26967]